MVLFLSLVVCFQVAHARRLGEYEAKHAGESFETCYDKYLVQQEQFSSFLSLA